MATSKYEIKASEGWVKVADTASDPFLIENQAIKAIRLTFADAPPAADAAFHFLKPGESMLRMASGHVYAAAQGETPSSRVVVSV